MRYTAIICQVLAWLWIAWVIIAVTGLAIYWHGFWDGLSRASTAILSPAALAVFMPSIVLFIVSALLKKAMDKQRS